MELIVEASSHFVWAYEHDEPPQWYSNVRYRYAAVSLARKLGLDERCTQIQRILKRLSVD